jgi:hypothetical protein
MKAIKVTLKIDGVDKWNIDWTNNDKTVNELMELNDDIRRTLAHHCGLEYRNITIDSTLIDY